MASLPDDLVLPTGADRDWLLDGLARVIATCGYEPFVSSHILLADDTYFPDPWQPGPEGAHLLLRRLMSYCGLDDYDVTLQVFREHNYSSFDHRGIGIAGGGAAAWFQGIHGQTCRFGVNERELRDTDNLIGTLCHEVAHAYRAHHRVVASHPPTEELLTDVTCVLLGFGVFVLNSSVMYRTGHYGSTGDRLLYERTERGYLPPGHLATLLAAQLVVRADNDARSAVLAELASNHAMLVKTAIQDLEPEEVRLRLALPDSTTWPRIPPLEDAVRDLDPIDASELIVVAESRERDEAPSASKLRHSRAGLYAVIAGVLFASGSYFIEHPSVPWVFAGVATAAVGGLLGHVFASVRCSACGDKVSRKALRCPGCGACFDALASKAVPDRDDGEDEDSLTPEQRADRDTLCVMLFAWIIERGMVTPGFLEAHRDLVSALDGGAWPHRELLDLWNAPTTRQYLTDEALFWVNWYFHGRDEAVIRDYETLTLVSNLESSRAHYMRFRAILDARWAARSTRFSPPLTGVGSDSA